MDLEGLRTVIAGRGWFFGWPQTLLFPEVLSLKSFSKFSNSEVDSGGLTGTHVEFGKRATCRDS